MARKKRVYSTKSFIDPKPEGVLPPAEESTPEVPPPVDGRYTLDQAIERFKKNPREEQFWCPGKKGFALAAGNRYLQFKDHFFTTCDPVEVELLMRSDDPGAKYNAHFFAINPELRNLKTK